MSAEDSTETTRPGGLAPSKTSERSEKHGEPSLKHGDLAEKHDEHAGMHDDPSHKHGDLVEKHDDLSDKLDELSAILRGYRRVVVAFSGGVDSTFLLAYAAQTDGVEATGVMVSTALVPDSDLEFARRFCDERGIDLIVVEVDALGCADVRDNPPDRCYHCKKLDMGAVMDVAADMGAIACDGMNVDDASDYRPGTLATEELGIRSPLAESGFTKQDIRKAAKALGLPNWDKPASACLASRIPYGTPLDADTLRRIGKAEAMLRAEGFPQVRVRMHGDVARIEVPADRIPELCSDPLRQDVAARMHEMGFAYVSCDMLGYRTGSLNEQLGL